MEGSKIITQADQLIDPVYDKYLDSPPTRRELQAVFSKIGINQTQLWESVDTQALVGNFLCDKLNVTRGELDAYVAKKAAELATKNSATGSTPDEAQNAQPNS